MPVVPGGRRCERCQQVVYDLSAMTAREADRFVAARAGEPTCYRYVAREDGTLVFTPEPVRAALTAAAVGLSLAACTPWGPPMQPESDIPDDMPAVHDAPTIIPPASPRLFMPRDEPGVTPEPVDDDDDGSPAPAPVAEGDVRYPRTPVARPAHVAKPQQPAKPKYAEYLGGDG